MEKILLDKSSSIFIAIWGLSIAFLWFRPRIEIFWKIIATLIFTFYIYFFMEQITRGFNLIQTDWYTVIISFIKDLIKLIFLNLFLLWPVTLIVIFYKSNDMGSERLLKFMCILTIVIWIILLVYVYHTKGINEFLFDKLKDMVPYAK